MVEIVKGEILFQDKIPSFAGATLYARVENTSVADVSSEVFAEYIQRNVSSDPTTTKALLFAINCKTPDPKASYVVRIHVDIDGDQEVSRGDYITTQSYPVLTFGYPNKLTVQVRQVR